MGSTLGRNTVLAMFMSSRLAIAGGGSVVARRLVAHIVACALFSVQILTSYAFGQTSYYVSSSGNDASDGKSVSTPWKTISKVNAVTFIPGDAILFQCGDQFRGQIELRQSGVTLGSYGSGDRPVITGAVPLTGWTPYGSFYVTKASAMVKNLFANGKQMTLARYPNSGFLPIATIPTPTTLTASGVNQPSGYWTGANFHGRTTDWTYETRVVTGYDGNTITLASQPAYPLKAGYGFYLDNKLAALDAPGEWYCDPATYSVYFYAPGGVDPNTLTVAGCILDYGVNSSQSNITVQGLEFDYQNMAGLRFGGSNNQLLSNKVFGSLMDGILFYGATGCTVNGNTIQYANRSGISGSLGSSTITNNIVKNIGLVAGYGQSGTGGMTGIGANGSYNTISNNIVDSIGYIGIATASSNVVRYNVITNVVLKLNDGGAIYTYQSNSNIIQNNIISTSVGNTDGEPAGRYLLAKGIYLDGTTNNYGTLITNNTIMNVASDGIILQYGSYGHTIRNNTLYKCATFNGGQSIFIPIDTTLGKYGQHVVKRNIFYPCATTPQLIRIDELKGTTIHSPGTLDSNYYFNPHRVSGQFLTFLASSRTTSWYLLPGWKAATGQDTHSYEKNATTLAGADSLFVNNTAAEKVVDLGIYAYRDIDNNRVTGHVTLAPYSSRLLFRDGLVAVEKQEERAPDTFTLLQNYPNPFNPSTVIRYHLPIDVEVRLEVFDSIGRTVAVLVDETQKAGDHQVTFTNNGLATGVYFYRLQAGSFFATRKLLLLK